MFKRLLLIAAFSVLESQAIGLQHALFRSQSTQGPPWTGTVNIQKEELTITVYPDYLDVQLDWELGVGGTAPASFQNALEIVGNVNFEANSTVIGMLLWNGDKILKAKLKTKDQARKEYETVVDRSSAAPPPPRDPVILEWVRQDNYDLSVFPVNFGGFRKIRIRYLVPATAGTFGFPHAYSDHAKVTFIKGSALTGFRLSRLNSKDTASFSQGEVALSSSDFGFQAYSLLPPAIERVIPITDDTSPGSRFYIGSFYGNGFSGQAVHAVYHLPAGLLGDWPESEKTSARIFATLFSGEDSCRKEVSRQEGTGNVYEELKILSRGTVDESLKWSVFIGDSLRKEVTEKPRSIRMEDGIQYARTFGNSKIYPLAKTMPFSLGSALGFIDTKYALVALEEDLLTAITADKYRLTGVPTLNPEDIFPSKEDTAVTTMEWSAARGYDPNQLLMPAYAYAVTSLVPLKGLPAGMRFELHDGGIIIHLDPETLGAERNIKVSIYTAMGREAKQWRPSEIAQGTLSWSPSESGLAGGAYLLKVETGVKKYAQPFFLR